jgi:hypothetical protein
LAEIVEDNVWVRRGFVDNHYFRRLNACLTGKPLTSTR